MNEHDTGYNLISIYLYCSTQEPFLSLGKSIFWMLDLYINSTFRNVSILWYRTNTIRNCPKFKEKTQRRRTVSNSLKFALCNYIVIITFTWKCFKVKNIFLITVNIQIKVSNLVPLYTFPLKSTLLPQCKQKTVHKMGHHSSYLWCGSLDQIFINPSERAFISYTCPK